MVRTTRAHQKARQAAVCAGIAAGKPLKQIADELGIHPNTVTDDLRAITDNFSAWADGETLAARATAIANLQQVINAAWAAYDEAWRTQRKWLKGDYDRVDVSTDPEGNERVVRRTPTLKLEMASYLDKITRATEALCRLTGIAAPQRLEVSGEDGAPLTFTISIDSTRPE